MKIRNESNDIIKILYLALKRQIHNMQNNMLQYVRRALRFIALPYCYLIKVNWKDCPVSRYKVIQDFIYIFFRLKYYPDNYYLCRLWEKDRSEWWKYYGSIYDPYQRLKLTKEVQKKEYMIIFNDKYVCYQLCKAADLPLPKQYACLENSDDYAPVITSILEKESNIKLIIKPAVGKGGKGIIMAYKKNNQTVVESNEIKIPINIFNFSGKSVIQKFIQQDERLSQISSSTNTVRLVTLLTRNNSVLILGGYMRFGVSNPYVDNIIIGGASVGFDIHSGRLNDVGYDSTGKQISSHPITQFPFKGFQIPCWSDVIELAKRIQKTFFYYKLLGCDIAITTDGPVIIEVNGMPDTVHIEQKSGPLLADENIKNEFIQYNLLINKPSRIQN